MRQFPHPGNLGVAAIVMASGFFGPATGGHPAVAGHEYGTGGIFVTSSRTAGQAMRPYWAGGHVATSGFWDDWAFRDGRGLWTLPGFWRAGALRGALRFIPGLRAGGAPRAGTPQSPYSASKAVQPGNPLVLANGQPAAGRSAGATTGNIASSNWAGYAVDHSNDHFRYIQAVFFVPYVNCSATPNSYSAHWVGMDGIGDSSVEQTGVLASCRGNTASYKAWYEMFPKLPVYPGIAVRPGDSVVVRVYYQERTRRFMLSLGDTSDGQHFSRALACPAGAGCRRMSAEVISEAPSSDGRLLPLSDFRAVSFSSIAVTDQSGHRAGLRARWWRTLRITTVGKAHHAVLDQPTQLYQGTALANYWLRTS